MVTVDIQNLLTWLALGALVLLLIYIVFLVKKLMTTLDKTNNLIDDADQIIKDSDKVILDANTVSGVVAKKTKQIDGAVDSLLGIVDDVADDAKNNKGLIKTTINAGKAVASAASYIKEKEEKKEEKEFKEYKKAKKAEMKAKEKAE